MTSSVDLQTRDYAPKHSHLVGFGEKTTAEFHRSVSTERGSENSISLKATETLFKLDEKMDTLLNSKLPQGQMEGLKEDLNLFFDRLSPNTNQVFARRVMSEIGYDVVNHNDSHSKAIEMDGLVNANKGGEYNSFLAHKTAVAEMLTDLAERIQKDPNEDNIRAFSMLVRHSTWVYKNGEDLQQRTNGLRQALEKVYGDSHLSIDVSKHNEDIIRKAEMINRYANGEKYDMGSYKFVDQVEDFNNLSPKDWVGEVYNIWRKKSQEKYYRDEQLKHPDGSFTRSGSDSEFDNKESMPVLDKITSLPPEVFELFIDKGKDPMSLDDKAIDQIISAIRDYDKKWFCQKVQNDDGSVSLEVKGTQIWREDEYHEQTNAPTEEFVKFYNLKTYFPDFMLNNARSDENWSKGSETYSALGGKYTIDIPVVSRRLK